MYGHVPFWESGGTVKVCVVSVRVTGGEREEKEEREGERSEQPELHTSERYGSM